MNPVITRRSLKVVITKASAGWAEIDAQKRLLAAVNNVDKVLVGQYSSVLTDARCPATLAGYYGGPYSGESWPVACFAKAFDRLMRETLEHETEEPFVVTVKD